MWLVIHYYKKSENSLCYISMLSISSAIIFCFYIWFIFQIERTIVGYILSLPNPELAKIPYENEWLWVLLSSFFFVWNLIFVVDFFILMPASGKKVLICVPFICVASYIGNTMINLGDYRGLTFFVNNIGDTMESLEKLILGFAIYYLRSALVGTLLKLRKPKNLTILDNSKKEITHIVTIKNYSMKNIYKVLAISIMAFLMITLGLNSIGRAYVGSI